MTGSALFSDCGKYRWRLDRDLGCEGPGAAVFGVNPSTAGAEQNDQTITKVIGFGRRLGWGRFIMANPHGLISTDVKALARHPDPIGPDNPRHLQAIVEEADILIAAWGPLAKLPQRLRGNWAMIWNLANAAGKPMHCWGTAADGHPRHPLMLAYDTPLVPWTRP